MLRRYPTRRSIHHAAARSPGALPLLGPALLIGLITGSALPAQVGLRDLPKIAEARAERLRPAMEKALEPFWPDLSLDPETNRAFLQEKYTEVAALGDGITPLLLEKLRPADDSDTKRHLAHNCASVLMRLDPVSMVPALLELLASPSTVARIQACRLLARTGSNEAGARLTLELPDAPPSLARAIGQALAQLDYRPAAPKVVARLLKSADHRDRRIALDYLRRNPVPEVLDQVLVQMAGEKALALLGDYIRYIGATGVRRADVAGLLLEYLDSNKLDAQATLDLIRAIGRVAPEGHKPTIKNLLGRIGDGTGQTARAMAFALRDLGEDEGVERLKLNLTRALDDANNRREARLWEQRGDLLFELELYPKAISDFKRAAELESYEPRRVDLILKVARCEAARERWIYMVRAFKDANVGKARILALAEEDPKVKEGLTESSVKRFLDDLE